LDGDFFALGGHSLSAVALADALVKTTGVTIPLSKLLASPTVREIAARIDRALYDPNAASQASSAEVATLTRDCQLPPPPSLVPQARARERWQTVLLTGVTGGLGRELLAALLQETHAQIVCLVRANTAAEARERLSRTLASMPRSGAHDRSRVRAVCAHLDRPRLGLSDANYAWLGTEVDAIIHAAAAVDFSLPYARLRTVNVEGTRALIELAFERRRKEFHYVSSLSALFPRTDTQGGILEEVAGPAPELLTMSYGQTKAVSERLLASAADLGLPVRIYRPSRICPSAHDPDADTLLGRFLRACIQLERFPSLPGDDNLIPASTAARLIVGVARKRDLPQRYFHIANPVSTPMSVFTSALQTCGYRLRPISFTAFCEQLHNTQLAPLADFFRRDSLLEFGLPRVSIDNTRSALGATALDCPRVDVDWAIQNLTGLLHPRTAERAA
jgi:thioester reductase-like protein